MSTNIDYWEEILEHPTTAYQELFARENAYLRTHIPNDVPVLEIGCGNGRNIETILPITKNIVGIDIEDSAVQKTRVRFKDIPKVQILKGDVLHLPFAEKRFDVITFTVTLGNLAGGKAESLAEMKRVLKDEGKVIMSVYSEDSLEERLGQYREINAPVEVEGTTVIFNGTIPSEQFSIPEIENLAEKVDMKILNLEKVGNLAYIFELTK